MSALVLILTTLLSISNAASIVATAECPAAPYFSHNACQPWQQTQKSMESGPWSHEPFCVRPTWDYKDNPDKIFCVYTSSKFRNGRGITIITTPEIADQIAETPAFSKPETLPEFQQNGDFLPYEAKTLPGRGVGLFANRTIITGETIFVDQPTIIVLRSAYRLFPEQEQELLQWQGVLQMPELGRTVSRNLAKAGEGDEIIDILQTNAFAQTYGHRKIQHIHLLPEGSRINHDCRPNAYYRYDSNTMTHYVWALRDIAPGEEITHSYIRNPEALCQTRKMTLKETWAFDCQCSICGASKESQTKSDQRLSKILVLKNRLFVTVGEENALNVTRQIEDLLGLYDEERLIFPKIEIFELGAYAFGQAGKEEMAMRYARRARQWWSWAVGKEATETRRIDRFIKHPERHPKWKQDDEIR